jgi:hypothetical protein
MVAQVQHQVLPAVVAVGEVNNMIDQEDPWSWMNQQKPVAPLAATIQPSQEQSPAPIVTPADTSDQQLLHMATPIIDQSIIGGYKGYQAAQAANAAAASQAAMAPLSANTVIGTAAPAMSVAPVIATPATAALTSAGVTGLTAPAMSTAAGAALGAGGTAAAAPLAAGLGTAGAGAGAMAGAQAGLAAMGPVGWAIGAGLLAKKFGLF